MKYLKNICLAAAAVIAVLPAGVAFAQYPESPVRMIVPYAPGGGTDTFARRLAAQLGQHLGQEVVIENIGGAGGNIGMAAVADAEPDGYTLAFALNAQFAINTSLFSDIPFDPIDDFEPISLIGSTPYVLVVHPELGVETVDELIDLARERPGDLSYASAGVGSGAHLATELFNRAADIDMLHIPYAGAGDAYPDLLAGRVDLMFATYAPIAGYVEAGSMIPIGVSSLERVESLPDIPTVAETFEGLEIVTWYALAAPAGTDEAVVDSVNTALQAALQEQQLVEQLDADNILIIGSSPDEFGDYLAAEIDRWAEVVEASGARAE